MASIIIAILMWSLVLVLVVFRRGKGENNVRLTALAIASSMTLSVDELYVIADGWFGANDVLHPISAAALMIGLFFLARGVARAGDLDHGIMRVLLSVPVLLSAIAVTVVAFFLVERTGGTSTTFMVDYGDQLAAGVYSGAQFLYLLGVLSSLLIIAVRELRSEHKRIASVAWLLAIGSVFGILLSVDVILMDVANVAGWSGFLAAMQAPYGVLQVATFLFLCSGLGLAPIVRWVRESRWKRRTTLQLERIHPLWTTATAARPSISAGIESVSPADVLHRRVVEIHDAALDNRNQFHLSDDDRRLLANVEDHLMSASV